jgi:hypothetical protein
MGAKKYFVLNASYWFSVSLARFSGAREAEEVQVF